MSSLSVRRRPPPPLSRGTRGRPATSSHRPAGSPLAPGTASRGPPARPPSFAGVAPRHGDALQTPSRALAIRYYHLIIEAKRLRKRQQQRQTGSWSAGVQGLWPCGRLDTMVPGPVAVLSKMAVDGDKVDDDDDRDMLLLPLLLCWNPALQRGPCDVPLVWVHVRVVESLWLQWPVAAGCGKPVAAGCGSMAFRAASCGRYLLVS